MGRVAPILCLLGVLFFGIYMGRFITEAPIQQSFGIVFVMILVPVSFFRPDYGVLIMLVACLLGPSAEVGAIAERGANWYSDRPISVRFEDIVIPIIFLGWWMRWLIQKFSGRIEWMPRTPLTIVITIFSLLALVSTVFGIAIGTTTPVRAAFFYLKRFEYFLVFFMTYHVIERKSQIRVFLLTLLGASFVVMLVGVYQVFVERQALLTSTFTGVGANVLADFLLMIIPLLICLRMGTQDLRGRPFAAFFIVLCFVVMVYTRSRGGYVSIVVTLMILMALTKRLGLFFPLLILFAGLYFLAPKDIRKEMSSIQGSLPQNQKISPEMIKKYQSMDPKKLALYLDQAHVDPSWGGRLVATVDTLQRIQKNIILGGGFGSVDLAAMDNQYGLEVASVGIIGFIAFWIMIAQIYRFLFGLYRDTHGPDDYWIHATSMAMLCGLGGMLLHGLTITNFYTIRSMVPFWYILGVLASGYRFMIRDRHAGLGAAG